MRERLMLIILCFFLGIGYAAGQTQNVQGVVIDENGEPLIGATISTKESTLGTATNVDGKFSLTIPSSVNKLVFSYVGYEQQTVDVKANMKVQMLPDSRQLTEVVVTGMTKIDKRLFTGATDRLNANEVILDGIPEISRGLEGKSAGVSVQNVSGTFGAAPKIRVRGATSIYGNSKPLWVVDGVVMEDVVEVSADDLASGDAITLVSSAISGLNADDIESFQILKDGSATSIYGARAMAGVIVITTKRGKAGVSKINYTGEYTTRLKPTYSEFNIMNSQEQMGIYQELQDKGWLNFAETLRKASSGVYGNMYRLIDQYDKTNGQFGLSNKQEDINAYLRNAEMRNTNWFDELFDQNLMQNHSVSVSTGTDRASFYGSLSAMIDPGWYKQSEVNRYTGNFNSSFKILKNLTLNSILQGSYRKQRAPGTLSQDVDPVNGTVKRDFDINPYSFAINSSRTLNPNTFYVRNYAPFNILHELNNNYMDLDVVDVKYQAELNWKILSELEISVLGAIKYSANSQEHKIKDASNQALAYRAMDDATIAENNPFLYTDPEKDYSLPISLLESGGFYQRTDRKMLGYDFRASATWNKSFNQIHFVNMYGGLELNSIERNTSYFNGVGTQYNSGSIPFYSYYFFKKSIEQNAKYYELTYRNSRIAAFFATANYSYAGKYILGLTGRYEGSNRVGTNSSARWLPTWNISGKWDVTEEKFFPKDKNTLSHAAVRASYSLTADQGYNKVSNSTSIINSYTPWRPTVGQTEVGMQVAEIANEGLTYEKKHEFNLGLDLGFLKNRINVEMDWFTRSNFDLIGLTPTNGVGGEILRYANVAEMKSSGFEFTFSSANINTKKFKWNSTFIFGHATTEITDLLSKPRVIDLISGVGDARKGYPHRALFSIDFKGLTEYGLPQFINERGELTISDINFQVRDDGKNALDFIIYEGPSDPTFNGSLGNIFSFCNFKLNIFCSYAFGNKVRLDPFFSNEYSDLDAMPKEFKNRWMMPGDEKKTNVPAIASKEQNKEISYLRTGYSAYNYSTERIAKGDFIRLKEVSLTYDFSKDWLPKEISNLSLKLQATNLFLLYSDSKLNGQDPEFYRSGGVSAPVPKQFTLTLRLGL